MLSLTMFAVLLGFGALAGFLAGLLGVGGGLVIVPVVVGVLEAAGLGGNHVQHLAVGTSLAVMVFTSFASVREHHKKGAVNWAIVRGMAPAMVLGTFAGSLLAGFIPSNGLKWFFVVYAYVIGAQMYLGAKPPASRNLPGRIGQAGAGSVGRLGGSGDVGDRHDLQLGGHRWWLDERAVHELVQCAGAYRHRHQRRAGLADCGVRRRRLPL